MADPADRAGCHPSYHLLILRASFASVQPPTPDDSMLDLIGRVLAALGAGMIITALAFVTLLIGALVNAMVVLIAGPVVDKLVKDKPS